MVFGDELWGAAVARRHLSLWTAMLVGIALLVGTAPRAQAEEPLPEPVPDSIGVVDTEQGLWWLRDGATGATTSFYYGNPGDAPFAGDWDCDGIDTPGLYRQSDGYVYLRNTNTQGIAHTSYFFGDPGDIPLAGDFNGDGCDTVSLFRPSTGHFYVINRLGSGDAGLGAADTEFPFGAATDTPFVGDFDNDGIDTMLAGSDRADIPAWPSADNQKLAFDISHASAPQTASPVSQASISAWRRIRLRHNHR